MSALSSSICVAASLRARLVRSLWFFVWLPTTWPARAMSRRTLRARSARTSLPSRYCPTTKNDARIRAIQHAQDGGRGFDERPVVEGERDVPAPVPCLRLGSLVRSHARETLASGFVGAVVGAVVGAFVGAFVGAAERSTRAKSRGAAGPCAAGGAEAATLAARLGARRTPTHARATARRAGVSPRCARAARSALRQLGCPSPRRTHAGRIVEGRDGAGQLRRGPPSALGADVPVHLGDGEQRRVERTLADGGHQKDDLPLARGIPSAPRAAGTRRARRARAATAAAATPSDPRRHLAAEYTHQGGRSRRSAATRRTPLRPPCRARRSCRRARRRRSRRWRSR